MLGSINIYYIHNWDFLKYKYTFKEQRNEVILNKVCTYLKQDFSLHAYEQFLLFITNWIQFCLTQKCPDFSPGTH